MKRLFTSLIVMSMAFSMAFAQNDLNLTFEDNSDLANWGHHDETNNWTTESWDATAGVEGSGGLVFGDAGAELRVLRPLAATAGTRFTLSMDIKVTGWSDTLEFPLTLSVRDLSTLAPSVLLAPDTGATAATFIHYTLSGIADANTAGYIKIFGVNAVVPTVVTVDNVVYTENLVVPNVYFSEYIEGSSNNKALEIYNGTGAEVDLADFQVFGNYNGNPWSEAYTFPVGAMLAAGDVFVIGNDGAVADILDVSDDTLAYGAPWFTASFNGDDVRGLAYVDGAFTTVIDLFGAYDMVDPGSGWDVAGVTTATANHTLIRKESVMGGNTNWAASAGTSADDSEWLVFDQNFYGGIGSHPYVFPAYAVTFSVDMNWQMTLGNFDPAVDHVDIPGSFNGWGGSDTLTDANADGIYEGVFDIVAGGIEYKYRLNNNWDTSESLGANRTYDVIDGENVIPTVWYSDAEPVTIQDVTVHFRVNTAGVPDTLSANSIVQVRGGNAPLTWDGNSPVILTNVGGDYWEGSAVFSNESAIQYKFYTSSYDTIFGGAEYEHAGWEGDLAGGNRTIDWAGFEGTDTTLDLQFVNGFLAGADQYDTPYTTNDSTFAFHVRVNMQGWEDFNSESMVVGIRGSNMSDWGNTGEIGWGTTYLLSQELPHANAGSATYDASNFYSGTIHVPYSYATAGLQFKYVVHSADADLSEDWGNMVYNTNIDIPNATTGNDTTIYWSWFDGLSPQGFGGTDLVNLTFKADLSNAIAANGFEIGDSVMVRAGYFGTADAVYTAPMVKEGLFGNIYAVAVDSITIAFDQPLYYQYYKVGTDGSEYREIYFNFDYEGNVASEAERRFVVITADNQIILDDQDSNVDASRMPLFRNTNSVSQDVTVTFTLDLRPAYHHVASDIVLADIQGGLNITTTEQIDTLGVFMNGPATGGWTGWGGTLAGTMEKELLDDGTHGDLFADDSIYAVQFTYGPDSANAAIGQEFKFGIGGGDNESGYGLNHIENLNDAEATYTVASSWGSINPNFYYLWDYDLGIPLSTDAPVVPEEFAVSQNYPNPFNPVTNIDFMLPMTANVKLTIFNVLGQEIFAVNAGQMNAGSHTMSWNSTSANGQVVPSGLYFYTLTAGNYSATKKMMLLK